MKRCFLLIFGLLVTPAIAEVSPFLSLDEYQNEYSDVDVVDDASDVQDKTKNTTVTPVKVSRQPAATASRGVSSRGTTSSRATPTSGTAASGRASSSADGRVVASRNTANTTSRSASDSARSVTGRSTTTSRTAVSPRSTATSARTATTNATRTATATRAATANATRSATSGRTATSSAGARTSRAATLTTSGASLYNRNSVSSTNVSGTSSKIGSRVPAIRVATSTSVADTAASTASALSEMDSLAEMTDYCKSQYAACMDNYCNVLDDNQGRCSCSANIKNYAKAESALKTATEELQDVAQKIQYIGLTTREIETLFTETEAEAKMSTLTDNSQIKTSLDKLKDMLIEVRTGTATSDATSDLSSFGFDANGLLDFSFDSTGFDLSSFLGGFGTGTSSVKNQRGEELYKTAVNRCKSAVLKSCTAQGVDANLVTNSYDLQIDKECILYERSLNDSNDEMVATIRNAKNVLQKARLLVSQQKNLYDMRGCINALDSCMQDEFVCGSDYENCLDPTGRYIVNGEIVLGSQPGHAIDPNNVYNNGTSAGSVMSSDVCAVNLYRTWDIPGETCTINAGNAWSANETLANYITKTMSATLPENVSENMSKYLQNKIGYADKDGRSFGMCMSVLNKCQDYTYTGSGTSKKYNPDNQVIQQYLARTLVQIKAKQDEILLDYADSCVSDVTTCLTQNNYDATNPGGVQSNLAINACRATIVTCMSVTGYSTADPTPAELVSWVCESQNASDTSECKKLHGTTKGISWYVNSSHKINNCPSTYTVGNPQNVTCDPVRDSDWPQHAELDGWCKDTSLSNCETGDTVSISASVSGSLTYFAKWSCASGYKQEGNTCVEDESGGEQCSSSNLSNCTTEDECTADGVGGFWCTKSDPAQCVKNEAFCGGGSGGDVVITYKYDKGQCLGNFSSLSSYTCKNNTDVPLLKGTGLTNFVGWTSGTWNEPKSGTVTCNEIGTDPNATVTLTASCSSGSQTVSITYEMNGHGILPASAPKSCTIGGTVELPSFSVVEQYQFKGWKKRDSESRVFSGIVTCADLGSAGETVALVAQWDLKPKETGPNYTGVTGSENLGGNADN